ncbi:MAG TPA: uracil-DNA glycosylase [Methylomirabilota bacterium]|jgi:DNA polymerase|nr:uracil-DNA glycosylase [Methylomirabilota bacterium]
MNKAQALQKISTKIKRCLICRKDSIGLPVVGEGDPDAKIVFIGEAPGKTESLTGRPFVGRSGKFLRAQLKTIGLDEKNVYITSPVKYLPKQGTPTPQQIAHGRTHLDEQLAVINPAVIVLMGRVAAEAVLGEYLAISKLHGQTIKKDNKIYFISYHPAAALRFDRKTFIQDFKKIRKLI